MPGARRGLARGALASGRLELGGDPLATGAVRILVLLVLVEAEARLDHLEPDESHRQRGEDPPPRHLGPRTELEPLRNEQRDSDPDQKHDARLCRSRREPSRLSPMAPPGAAIARRAAA